MKKLVFGLLLFAVGSVSADFAKYIEMTVNYTPTAAVDGFPVLVRLNSSRISYADVKNAGADLKFTDVAGETVYPHEVDTWNPAGESLVWVRLPQLAKGAKFRMYYGDATVTTSPSPVPVWQGYDLVCHVSGTANDSATPDRAGALNPLGSTKTDGIIGKAHGQNSVDQGAAIYHRIYDVNASGTLANGQFSYSFWVRFNATPKTWTALVGPCNSDDVDAWGLRMGNATNKILVRTAKSSEMDVFLDDVETGKWRKIDVAMKDAEATMWVDGVLAGHSAMAKAPTRCWVQFMGWGGCVGTDGFNATAGKSFAGDFDECRIYPAVIDSARVAADYATVKNTDFLSFQAPRDNIGEPGSALVLH